jgi:hypothetical protein
MGSRRPRSDGELRPALRGASTWESRICSEDFGRGDSGMA